MGICGSYMFEFSISKDMKKKDIMREVAVGKVTAHLCITLRAALHLEAGPIWWYDFFD
jgi:hypothetical protein